MINLTTFQIKIMYISNKKVSGITKNDKNTKNKRY